MRPIPPHPAARYAVPASGTGADLRPLNPSSTTRRNPHVYNGVYEVIMMSNIIRPTFSNNWFEVTAKPVWDRIIPEINPRTALEIGSFEGASACYLIEHCASSSPFVLHCIDT
jgi:hypothetical protein